MNEKNRKNPQLTVQENGLPLQQVCQLFWEVNSGEGFAWFPTLTTQGAVREVLTATYNPKIAAGVYHNGKLTSHAALTEHSWLTPDANWTVPVGALEVCRVMSHLAVRKQGQASICVDAVLSRAGRHDVWVQVMGDSWLEAMYQRRGFEIVGKDYGVVTKRPISLMFRPQSMQQ